MTRAEFFSKMEQAATAAKAQGAVINTVSVIAQAANESGWGNSLLTRKAHNLFGIKAGSSWRGATVPMLTREWAPGRGYYTVTALWRAYPTWADCVVDYAALIARLPWFKDALPHADPPAGDGNARGWIQKLVDVDYPGELRWATSPAYVEHVSAVFELLPPSLKPRSTGAPAQPAPGLTVALSPGGPLPAEAVEVSEGRVFVHVRALDPLGIDAVYDPATRTVTLSRRPA